MSASVHPAHESSPPGAPRLLLAAALAAGLCGCAPIMGRAKLVPVDAKTATVTFVRPAGYFGEESVVGLWDGEHLVGYIRSGQLIQYRTTPGAHLFVADAEENWSYARASLAAGKEYYIKANMFPGILAFRVALATVPKRDDRVPGWRRELEAVARNQNDAAASDEAGRVAKVREAIDKFKSGAVKSFAEVKPDDGR